MADEARVRKVQERILQTVASMIGRHVKDPRLELVTITDVRVTGDLQHASIFYTVLGDDEQREKAARAFASAQGLFRSRVGKALGLRPGVHPRRAARERRRPGGRPGQGQGEGRGDRRRLRGRHLRGRGGPLPSRRRRG